MRRDRFLVAATLTALFSADLYFILLPKLWSFMQASGHFCSCASQNLSLPALEGLGPPRLSNWTSATPPDDAAAASQTADGGSKLEKLFAHPLYNIQTPALGPEERLLQAEQLNEYYMKKVSHWERSVSVYPFDRIFCRALQFVSWWNVSRSRGHVSDTTTNRLEAHSNRNALCSRLTRRRAVCRVFTPKSWADRGWLILILRRFSHRALILKNDSN